MKINILTFFFFFSSGFSPLFAQVNNGDCLSAIEISDTTNRVLFVQPGFGDIQEIKGTKEDELYFFNNEVNSGWYEFVVPYDAKLTFEIIPIDKNSDIDFLLFESKDENTCEQIKNKEIKPVRTNIARNDTINNGITGLSENGTTNYVKPGLGNNFSKSIDVQRGQEYFLVLNNLAEDKLGHKIKLIYKKKNQKINEIPKYTTNSVDKSSKTVKSENAGISLKVEVRDSKENKPINVTLEVDGIVPGKPMVVENRHSFTYILEKRKHYLVKCIYQGFMLYSEEIVAPENAKKIDLNIKLDPIKKGAKVALHNIRFKPNGNHILRSSESELQALVKFMEKNPEISIKINGHVNAPKMKNTSELQKLSRDRAKAVYVYLVEHGVSKRRLKFEGFGNEQMIYPIPITHEQERANRRVEIEIL